MRCFHREWDILLSGIRESNSRLLLGKQPYYHCTNPANTLIPQSARTLCTTHASHLPISWRLNSDQSQSATGPNDMRLVSRTSALVAEKTAGGIGAERMRAPSPAFFKFSLTRASFSRCSGFEKYSIRESISRFFCSVPAIARSTWAMSRSIFRVWRNARTKRTLKPIASTIDTLKNNFERNKDMCYGEKEISFYVCEERKKSSIFCGGLRW